MDDFSGVRFLDGPTLLLERVHAGEWRGMFSAQAETTTAGARGTFVVLLPKGTEVVGWFSERLDRMPSSSERAHSSWWFENNAQLNPPLETNPDSTSSVGASDLEVVEVPFPSPSSTPKRSSGVSSAISPGHAELFGFVFKWPKDPARRVGWGKEQFRLAYWPENPLAAEIPYVSQPDRLRGMGTKADATTVDPVSLRIAVQFNADRKQLIDPTPEPTGGSYGLRQWDVGTAKQKLLVEGVFQDIWGRWWIDRASDVLFLVLGLLVGVHQGHRRSVNTGTSP